MSAPTGRTRRGRGTALGAAVLLLGAGLAACSTSTQNRPTAVLDAIEARSKPVAVVAAPAGAAQAACSSPYKPEASYDPLPSVPSTPAPGTLAAAIRQRGRLVVGVSGDTRLLGSRNKLTDPAPAGFDIEIARAIGRALLGPEGTVEFRVITAAERFPLVNKGVDAGGVDLVARAVSMTCDRWAATDPAKGSAFSAAYLLSEQRLLLRPQYATLAALVKARTDARSTARICAPAGSTSLAAVQRREGVTAVPVAIHSDCLALWQEGRVDAITGDDVILAGFQSQDPTARIVSDASFGGRTPYGLAVARSHPDFVRYVNAVMATPQFRAAWETAYRDYLADPLRAAPQSFPAPVYGRPVTG